MVATEPEIDMLVKAVEDGMRKQDYSGVHKVVNMICSHWLVRNECKLCLIKESCDRKFCVRFQMFLTIDRDVLHLK